MLKRTLRHVRVGSLLWKLHYDQTAEHLYVQFEDSDYEDVRESADGHYLAYIRYDGDGLPVLVGLRFEEPIRLGVMVDWVHEAAELALAEFGDDFVKGTFQMWLDEHGEEVLVTTSST